jgi:hypothetical protein
MIMDFLKLKIAVLWGMLDFNSIVKHQDIGEAHCLHLYTPNLKIQAAGTSTCVLGYKLSCPKRQ